MDGPCTAHPAGGHQGLCSLEVCAGPRPVHWDTSSAGCSHSRGGAISCYCHWDSGLGAPQCFSLFQKIDCCSSTLNFTCSYLAKGSSRTPFTPGLGYRESGGLLTPDHLDTCHSLPACVESWPHWAKTGLLPRAWDLIHSFIHSTNTYQMFTSVPCTVVGTGNGVSSKTKSPIQWEEKDNKQTNEYSVCQWVIDAT